jgi:ATP-dependent helicase/nuclease subunit A
MTFVPVDEEERARARHEHETSFVLEAGAGTGKTTLLIDRIESLLVRGTADLDQIAAVTFSENAATTLKLRLRERLERARAGADARSREAAARALDVLERAAITTLHAFCALLLQERPLDCGVVPGFRVADEAEAELLFAEAWDEWIAERLETGDDAVLAAIDADIPIAGRSDYEDRLSLRGLARSLIDQRDLAPLRGPEAVDSGPWRDELLARGARANELLSSVHDASADLLAAGLSRFVAYAEAARGRAGPELHAHRAQFPALLKGVNARSGDKARWTSESALAEGREIVGWMKASVEAWEAACGAALQARLVAALGGVAALYEEKKASSGLLDFLDLLLRTRDALEAKASVRRYFAGRFPFVIIDEFQDTDPLQVRIAELLTQGRPGALVVVGDAKQSIYRFRRADVRLFTRLAAEADARAGHAVLRLTQNFRSRPGILRFVNGAFADLIVRSDEAGQPEYQPIQPVPDDVPRAAVVALRYEAPFEEREGLVIREALALARFLDSVAHGRYEVRDARTGAHRPSRAGDVMVLARRLTYAHHLEHALEEAGLRLVSEGGKSFFDRLEVHELLAVLRAVDDPADRVSLVGALRSSFFGASDRDIACYALSGGGLSIFHADGERAGGLAVAPALEAMLGLHRARTSLSPAALIERLYDETRILAALTGTRRGEAQVANLQKAVSMAREAETLGVLTLRGFIRLLEGRIRERSDEPDLPSTRSGDPHTVRLLSIHKAKGLEAPIVVLFDGADDARTITSTVPLWDEGRIAIGFRKGCQPPGWDALRALDERRGQAEMRRLLYVACTRARDLLVLPVPPPDARPGDFWKPLVERLPAADAGDVEVLDVETLPRREAPDAGVDFRALATAEGGDPIAVRWEAQRRALLEAAAVRPFVPVSATRRAAQEAPPAVEPLASPGGRRYGALVHRILEWLPLDRAGDARAMAEALAPAFGIDADGARTAAEAVVRALGLPVMDRARRAAHLWRELPVWLPDAGDLIEGVLDLAFEEDGALVVVDYKSDHVPEDRLLDQAAHHAPQLRLYGRALTQATGLPVRERLVLFTTYARTIAV